MSEAFSTFLSQTNFVLNKSMNVWLHYASYSCQCLTIFSALLNPVKFTFSLLLNRLFCAVCFFCTIMSRLVCVTPVLSLTADWNEAMPCWSKARPEKCLNKCQSLSERILQTEQARKFPAKWLFIEMHQVPQTRNTKQKHADYGARGPEEYDWFPARWSNPQEPRVCPGSIFAVESPAIIPWFTGQEQIPFAGCHS